ncbi:AAA family ATPase [Aliarcobacter cryaerophilus]|uniref:AAA family ATPase n=1 Tax=Aliarcobacter cryaerophilus TaxID=28198 RepID=UPI0021B3B9B6|nr:AAA family ATPase [Aliarcobacter cryaerophilus]MCT7464887.1 AAA family ATPase [Aliarcobacter cryaerophilus]
MIDINEGVFYNSFIEKGFKYDKDLLFNYFNALQTKPFVILTGISGSGKSKIAQIFSETLSPDGKKLFELIPVKPNWRDSKSLFGYHNLIDDTYSITPLIKLFIKAINDKENPYFLILDEMNLAKTEHYFADYLSLIESRRFGNSESLNLSQLRSIFTYPNETTLSEAIILSAFLINKPTEVLDVSEYRNTIFSELWKEQFYRGMPENWTAQFRSELNQGENRFAHRVFESIERGKYKLKDFDSLSQDDQEKIQQLKDLFNKIMHDFSIEQQNIVLHNSIKCLSPEGEKCNLDCNIANCNKYKCDKIYNSETESFFIPPEIPIPINVFTIGTVNVDETTYMFSPKVLDRANVIEFNNVDFKSIYEIEDTEGLLSNIKQFKKDEFYFNANNLLPSLEVSIATSNDVKNFKSSAPEEFKDILKIFIALEKENMHFGYRVMNEISLYMNNVNLNTSYAEKYKIATDLQILQKILPKIYGTFEKIWFPLVNILNVCLFEEKNWSKVENESDLIKQINSIEPNISSLNLKSIEVEGIFKYPRTANKILSMLIDLNNNGYASFIK